MVGSALVPFPEIPLMKAYQGGEEGVIDGNPIPRACYALLP